MANFDDIASLGEAALMLDLSKRQAERVILEAGIRIGQLPGSKGAKIVSRADIRALAADRRAELEARLARMQGAAS